MTTQHHINRFTWLFVLPLLLLALLLGSPQSAFAATQASAAPQLTGCTPNLYHPSSTTHIWDIGTGTVLGEVDVLADGCGWVEADAITWTNGGVINHLDLYYSYGTLITVGPRWGFIGPTHTGSAQVYALGVIQDPIHGWWGLNTTTFTTGYSYYRY